MPVGVIINACSVALGGILGALMENRIPEGFKDNMNLIFGLSSMAMGVASVVHMGNMPAVVFAVILGTGLGLAVKLGDRIAAGAGLMQKGMARLLPGTGRQAGGDFTAALVTIIVLFCASGTGIYGSMVSGMTGDHSILIAKSVLDLFTALIFACSLGPVVAAVALLQGIIMLGLFFCAGLIFPLTTPTMINDFKACGGFIMIASGFRIIKVRMFPTADMIPAMALVMPLSWFWTAVVAPAVAALG